MRYYFWILGCAMNYSDAERVAAVLDSAGHERIDDEKKCDLFVVVSCSVRQTAIDRIYGKINQISKGKKKPKTALTGCLLDADRKKLAEKFDIVFDIQEISALPKFLSDQKPVVVNQDNVIPTGVEESLEKSQKGISRQARDDRMSEYLSIVPAYESSFRAFVPIMTGCNNFCSYCAVPYTRGREKSRPMNEIVQEVKDLIKKGYKEITLLGQNVNSYGNDLTHSVIPTETEESLKKKLRGISRQTRNDNLFIDLILKIDKIPGDYRVYFYSNHPKDMSNNLVETLPKLKHFLAYIHLPLQSGNNEILRKMNRHYTKAQYLDLIKKIRKTMPDVTLTTDIIVGFPGETKKQFEDTKDVMKKAKFDMAFLAQYSPRPGTASAKMPDDVIKEEKKRRENELQQILARTVLANNKRLVGKTVRVLIDEEKRGKLYGRTEGYKVTEIDLCHPERVERVEGSRDSSAKLQNDKLEIGQFIDVKITSTESWKLKGELS